MLEPRPQEHPRLSSGCRGCTRTNGQWREAYEALTRLSRLRKTDDSLVLGYLQAEMGREAARGGPTRVAEAAYRTALALDRRVFPAQPRPGRPLPGKRPAPGRGVPRGRDA